MKRTFEASGSEYNAEKASRRQDPTSCQFCRKKKLKCDRGTPCSNCRARRLSCSFSPNTKIGPSSGTSNHHEISSRQYPDVENLGDRVKKLEELLALGSSFKTEDSFTKPSNQRQWLAEPFAAPNEDELSKTVTWVETGVIEPVCARTIPTANADLAYCFKSLIPLLAQPLESITLNRVSFKVLPSRLQAQILVQSFILEANWMYHMLHGPTLTSLVESVYDDLDEGRQPNIPHLTLVTVVFTISVYYSTPESVTFRQHKTQAHSWAQLIQDAFCACDVLAKPTLESLQALALVCQCFTPHSGSILSSRMSLSVVIHLARMLSIHQLDTIANKRRRESSDQVNWVEIETKRSLWWTLVTNDWLLSFLGGVPSTYNVQPEHMTVDYPTNTNDNLISAQRNYALPEEVFTDTTSLRRRILIAKTYRDIVDLAWESGNVLDELPYELILAFDKRLNDLLRDLDSRIDLMTANASTWDDRERKSSLIARQRRMDNFSVHSRLSRLHRPFLIRGAQDPRYAYSRMACLRSARFVVEFCNQVMEEQSNPELRKVVPHAHCLFVSTTILVMDYCFNRAEPRGKERKEEIRECFKLLENNSVESVIAKTGIRKLREMLCSSPDSGCGKLTSSGTLGSKPGKLLAEVESVGSSMPGAAYYTGTNISKGQREPEVLNQYLSSANLAQGFSAQVWSEDELKYDNFNLDMSFDANVFEAFLQNMDGNGEVF